LPDCRSIRGITSWRDIINFKRNEIATPELAIDGEVEDPTIPNATFVKLSTSRLRVFGAKRRLGSNDLFLVRIVDSFEASPHRKCGLCHCCDRASYLRLRCGLLGVNLEKIGPLYVFMVEAAREHGLHHHEVGR
jgi:hypothetical protein